MGAVSNESMKEYAENTSTGLVPPAQTPSDQLAQDVKKFIDSPAEVVGFLKQAKELYAAGSLAEANALVDRAVSTMEAAFNDHVKECEGECH